MASLYSRSGSPFLWLKFKNQVGQIKQISTECRETIAPEYRRARKLEAEKTLAELSYGPATTTTRWEDWVDGFFQTKYGAARTATLARYQESWRTWLLFFESNKTTRPSQVLRQHCFDFVTWRKTPNLKSGKYTAGHNTALLDLKTLNIVMTEAVIRGYCIGNPCVKLGIKKARPKVRPTYSQEDLEFIREKIATVTDEASRTFLLNSFDIGRYQGCRLAETRINPQTDIDIPNRCITLRIKGDKEHITLLHEKLVGLFERLRAEGSTATWDAPPGARRQWASGKWLRFLRRIGMPTRRPGACFHSLRHTAINDMFLAGVAEHLRKQFVGQSSTTVHRGYVHMRPQDLRDCANAIL